MNPLFRIDFSISDSLKIVRKSVLIYETIIFQHEEVGEYIGYGLQALDADGKVLHRAEDLSTDEELVRQWARLLNEEQLELVHFFEVVEDLLLAR